MAFRVIKFIDRDTILGILGPRDSLVIYHDDKETDPSVREHLEGERIGGNNVTRFINLRNTPVYVKVDGDEGYGARWEPHFSHISEAFYDYEKLEPQI